MKVMKNINIVHIFGLRRSGNHLISQMLEKNAFPGKKAQFFNDIYNPRSKQPRLLTPQDIRHEVHDESSIILGYENVELEIARQLPTVTEESSIIKDSKSLKILVIRDPYNFIASWLKMADMVLPNGEIFRSMRNMPIEEVKKLWIDYANEALGITKTLGIGLEVIKYNNWVASKDYRDKVIFDNFGVVNRDLGINTVSEFGHGSSFDGTVFDGRASLMDVNKRWEKYHGDPRFMLFTNDREVEDLSIRLFGYMPYGIEKNGKLKET